MPLTMTLPFGPLLKTLRKQAGMTQRDLAAALGYSESLISCLEKAQRQPDLQAVTTRFIPALGLQDDPHTAATLIEQAALARGERPPVSVTLHRTAQLVVTETFTRQSNHLPAPPTALLGRDQTVNVLCNRLQGHSGRLLTLVGPPGIGKTTLALAVAARLQLHYRDGAVFVPLAAISDPTLMAATIAAAVGSSDVQRLIEFLRRKTMLLVLDNLEQLLPHPSPPQIREGATRENTSVGLIAELIAECPGLCILATSRERLHMRAEQRYKVLPLDLAPAVELFTQRAQAVDADFSHTPHNQPTLAAICQRLDCLPLAIELCAAQIDILPPAQLLAQLQDHRLDLLVDGAHDLPPRQRTLRTAIGYSYALLNETERLLLRTLSVFAGGFTFEAVEAIVADGLEPAAIHATLHALISKSLVRAETLPSGEQRFLLLETIREFALEQLRAHGEEALLRQRHYAIYLQRFRTVDSHLRGPDAATWFARLVPEQDNLRAALRWALDEMRYEDVGWLIVTAEWFWHFRGQWYERGQWLQQLLPHRLELPLDLRLTILISLYGTARIRGEDPPFDCWTGELMELLEVCPDKLQHASVWHFTAYYADDLPKAAAAWELSIVLARTASKPSGLGPEFGIVTDRDFVLGNSIWAYASRLIEHGKFARALPLLRESLEIFQARGSRYEIVDSLGTLGRLALLQGDLAQAHKLLHEAVTITADFNYQRLGDLQSLLGLVILYGGDMTEASRLLSESLNRCLAQKHTVPLARVCSFLAETALCEGEIDEAEQWLRQSLAYHADPQQIRIEQVKRLWVAARLATVQQQYTRAATLFGVAEQMHSHIHYAIAGPMRSLADATLTKVQTALEPALFAEAFATGQQMSLAEAFATILAPTQFASALVIDTPA